jgi:Mn2+/Fe2+ NRAMP family transporter
LLAYVGTVFVVHIPWTQFLTKTVVFPQLPWKSGYITTIVAVFGTTISPYFFLAILARSGRPAR